MQKDNFHIYFGIWIMILSIIGIPNIWKVYLTFASGALLVLFTTSPLILRYLMKKDVTDKTKDIKIIKKPKKIKPSV